ncbi:hypothetical protein TL16_g01377 [Triparma laevis f. inornata]|uniref:Uncharacterized protein n=1 Tax=Triparma laevis f. inornata TaxID=1714386 RepID=A0A9W6ZJ02_9STRA|nr:hypothetical protein TL16_g01377 [Triparma laevis f. inornata]
MGLIKPHYFSGSLWTTDDGLILKMPTMDSTTALSITSLTPQQWSTFDRDGYVVIPNAIQPITLSTLQTRINDIMMGTADVEYDKLMMQLDSPDGSYANTGEQTMGFKGPTFDYRKIQNLDEDKILMDYMRAPIFSHACEHIYGATTPITSFRCMFFNKPKGKETPVNYMEADTVASCQEFEVANREIHELTQGGEKMGKRSALADGGLTFPMIFDWGE